MKVTIRIDATTGYGETGSFEICRVERRSRDLEPLKIGLSLADGKDILC
ncbi:hypothetical protein [Burkholderia sp. Ac-20353]|nr:hypothetical protein [Burkholderia sp. Ac-20353]MBN3785719.1 hypothetical protein [Burkholderia sp. Ac-20353]